LLHLLQYFPVIPREGVERAESQILPSSTPPQTEVIPREGVERLLMKLRRGKRKRRR